MYYIGIDWGAKDCGIAWADEETRIATAYKQVPRKDLLKELKQLNDSFGIAKIVLGVNYDIDKEKRAKLLESFKEMELETEFENESFSTLLAQSNLAETKGRNISKYDDAEAARIILQSWLDKR
ncbi:MAG: RuvX/YqgF family protein [Candidatus Moranbacteria bacterium]|nr:RuvX/YqgF family protein [Candidatus Moranbacteria bacterium]